MHLSSTGYFLSALLIITCSRQSLLIASIKGIIDVESEICQGLRLVNGALSSYFFNFLNIIETRRVLQTSNQCNYRKRSAWPAGRKDSMKKEELGKLILENKETLYRVAKTLLYNDTDCADAIQEAITKAFSKIYTLQQDKYAKTWLIRILINECYAIMRSEKRIVSLESYKQIVLDERAEDKRDCKVTEEYGKCGEKSAFSSAGTDEAGIGKGGLVRMKLERMKNEFPKMPEEIEKMVVDEVGKQMQYRTLGSNRKWYVSKTVAAAVLLAFLAVGTTVYAAVYYYQMTADKVGEFGVETNISLTEPEEIGQSEQCVTQIEVPRMVCKIGYVDIRQ